MTEGERLYILFEQKGDRTHDYFISHQYAEVGLKDYRRMISGKTAALLAAACRLGALVGGATLEEQACAEKYGWAAGIAFQLADDYLDIFAISEEFGKEVYKDLIEKKLGNFVIVEALRLLDSLESKKLSEFITDENLTDEERIEKCVPLIRKSNAKEAVMKEAELWAQKAIMILKTVEFHNEEFRGMLEKIAEFSVRRAF